MRELVYYVAVSLDGYIAGPDGQFDAFSAEDDLLATIIQDYPDTIPTHLASQLGVEPTGRRFGAAVMGAHTYAVGLPEITSPYQHLEQVVFTHRSLAPGKNLQVTGANPVGVIREMKQRSGPDGSRADIWLCGGGNLASQLRGEIDRLILKRQPVLLGSGIPLFAPGDYEPLRFERVSARDLESGVSIEEHLPRR